MDGVLAAKVMFTKGVDNTDKGFSVRSEKCWGTEVEEVPSGQGCEIHVFWGFFFFLIPKGREALE